MTTSVSARNLPNPLLLPEIVACVVDNICMGPDLLSCACVNSLWNKISLKKLYKGSLNDMKYRTPDIGSLNCLYIASRERFTQNMDFVKHLLLAPDTPSLGDSTPVRRLACFEKLRPLRRRLDAERLFRPQGSGGIVSLTIPFEIVRQNWSINLDLLLSPTVEYLAVDSVYCFYFVFDSSNPQGPITFSDRVLTIKALTLYRSENDVSTDMLCDMIELCDLQFFHFEERWDNRIFPTEIPMLLESLGRQQNLKTLVLILPNSSPDSTLTRMIGEEQRKIWPNLKALHFRLGNEHWIEQVPDFSKLQILCIQKVARGIGFFKRGLTSETRQCRDLQVLDIRFQEYDEGIEALLGIVYGCPLLKKLRILHEQPCEEQVWSTKTGFSSLLRALPHLEYLELDLKFRLDGARIQDIAADCPRLTVLRLSDSQLCLSLAQMMRTATPLWQLELMFFANVLFENPRGLMEPHRFCTLAAEWSRIFPKLRQMPCPFDLLFLRDVPEREIISGSDNRDERPPSTSEDTETSHHSSEATRRDVSTLSGNEEMSTEDGEDSEEDSDEDDGRGKPTGGYVGSDWHILRVKLWRELHYTPGYSAHERIANLWTTNFEIEKIGWPIMPLEAFCNRKSY